MSDQSDLKVLFPEVDVKLKGKDMRVKPFGFGQLARVARLVRPIAQALLDSHIMTIERESGSDISTIKIDSDFIPKLFVILDTAAEPLMELLAFAIGQPRSWLDDLPADEGVNLAMKAWEVNSDFFASRVMPMLGTTFTKSISTGDTSSQVSSEPGTVAQT